MVEARDLGGTCPNRGCTPKKVLVAAAMRCTRSAQAHVHRISVGKPDARLGGADRPREGDDRGHPGFARRDVAGPWRRADPRAAPNSSAPTRSRSAGADIEAKHIVIATGSKPRPLPIPGAELMITSDEVLSEREQPDSVRVRRRRRDRARIRPCLCAGRHQGHHPRSAAAALAGARRRRGRAGAQGERAHRHRRAYRRQGETRGDGEQAAAHRVRVRTARSRRSRADRVVNGAGRIANVDQLDLDAGNVAHDRLPRRASIDHLRSTSNPSVHVCGDVLPASPQLSPIATYEGRLVGRNIVEGPKHKPDYASHADRRSTPCRRSPPSA